MYAFFACRDHPQAVKFFGSSITSLRPYTFSPGGRLQSTRPAPRTRRLYQFFRVEHHVLRHVHLFRWCWLQSARPVAPRFRKLTIAVFPATPLRKPHFRKLAIAVFLTKGRTGNPRKFAFSINTSSGTVAALRAAQLDTCFDLWVERCRRRFCSTQKYDFAIIIIILDGLDMDHFQKV